MTTNHCVACLSILGLSLWTVVGCGADDWKCAPPSGAVAAQGTFDLDFTGETAAFASDAMRVYVTPASDGTDDETLELWACLERGKEMWTADVTVTRPNVVTTLPARFGLTASTPGLSAWMTRYDDYQVLEEQLGDGLSASVAGNLEAFDLTDGALTFSATLTEPCPSTVCQADTRDLVLQADLTWEPR